MKGNRGKTEISLNREGRGIWGSSPPQHRADGRQTHVQVPFFRQVDTKQAFNHLNIYDKKARWLILPLTFRQAGTASPLPQGQWRMSLLIPSRLSCSS